MFLHFLEFSFGTILPDSSTNDSKCHKHGENITLHNYIMIMSYRPFHTYRFYAHCKIFNFDLSYKQGHQGSLVVKAADCAPMCFTSAWVRTRLTSWVFSRYSGFLPLHCLIYVYHVSIVYMFVSSLYDLRVLIKGCKTATTNQPTNITSYI